MFAHLRRCSIVTTIQSPARGVRFRESPAPTGARRLRDSFPRVAPVATLWRGYRLNPMANAYTPGLKVSARTRHQARRLLPISGDVLVKVGDQVNAQQIVAQTFMPGDVTPLNMANLLSTPPADVPTCLLKELGDRIEIDELLARTKGIFGRFRTEYKSKVTGTIESISSVTGQVIVRGEHLPVTVKAYLSGAV